MQSIVRIGLTLSLLSLATPLSAQSLSFGLRGTGAFPTGDFGEQASVTQSTLIQGAKNGFGFGAEAGLAWGMIGAYASFDHIQFDCETSSCLNNGEYRVQGITGGIKVWPSFFSQIRPFLKAGLTMNDLKGGYGGSSSNVITTDKNAGYEFGAGADFGFLALFNVSPQVRYVGQNLQAQIPGVTNTSTTPNSGVNYWTFDLGITVHTPFSGH
jgi:hypothetical protein